MTSRKMKMTTLWTGFGIVVAAGATLLSAPVGSAQQGSGTPAGTVPVSEITARLSKDSGLQVLTDSTLKVNVSPLKTKTTPANVEQQIRALVKTLPAGTIWGKLYLPIPKTGTYKGDDVAAFAFASGQLFGPVGAPDPADTVEVMGKRIPADSAKEIIAQLKLKPVYLLSNPRLGRNGFLVEGPMGGPMSMHSTSLQGHAITGGADERTQAPPELAGSERP